MADAVAEAGYGSESRVYEKSGELLGMTPGALRRGGAGEVIRTAFADCPFGRLLVGATDRGVCFIGFAEPDEALLGDLRQRFPRARIVADDSALANEVRAVLDFLEEPKQALDLPLDLRGTAFQQRVWRTLCRIPRVKRARMANWRAWSVIRERCVPWHGPAHGIRCHWRCRAIASLAATAA